MGGTGISNSDNFSYRSNFRFRSRYRSSSSSTTSGGIFYCSGSRQLNHSSSMVLMLTASTRLSKQTAALYAGAGHFGHRTLRHRDTSAPQNWCRSLSRITGGTVSHRNSPGWEVSQIFLDHGTRVEVSRITFLGSKCLEIGAEVSQSVLMPKSVLCWPKCPVTLYASAIVSWQLSVCYNDVAFCSPVQPVRPSARAQSCAKY